MSRAKRTPRGGAVVVLDLNESVVTLYALKGFLRLMEQHPPKPDPNGEFDLPGQTQALHDRIEKRLKPLRVGV